MGHQSVVYGRIIGDRYPWGGNVTGESDMLIYHKHNKRIIEELPEKDDYPHLTRPMFNVPALEFNGGLYKNQVITFGASFKEIEDDWREWISKFENLLTKLYWTDVIVYLESDVWGDYKYKWKSNADKPGEKNTKENWTFDGGPLDFVHE